MTYVRSLDGLRGIAVALVMLTNFRGLLEVGWIGVPIFYALSGFLITRILVHAKADTSLGSYLLTFEARRALRIVPIYAAYLGVLGLAYALTGRPSVVPSLLPWAATYTLNFAMAFDRVPIRPFYAHFWSLSVEEQFYLVWPFVVWFASRSSLRRIVVGLVVASFVLRGVFFASGLSALQIYLLTPSHLDALALGASVAVFDLSAIRRPARWSLALGVALLAMGALNACLAPSPPGLTSLGLPEGLPANAEPVWGYTVLDLFSASLVLACVRGGLPWLESRPLVELGRISYGLYVLHRPLASALDSLDPRLAPLVPSAPFRAAMAFVIYVVVSVGLARLSYVYFEAPILALRTRLGLGEARRAEA